MPYFNEPNDCRGWWTSRTGLEQKLIILSTILFIVAFSLTITTIVYKNRSCPETTTVAPPITSPVTGETFSTSVVTGDTSPDTGSPITDTSPSPASETSPSSESTPSPQTTPETSPSPSASSNAELPSTSPSTPAPTPEKGQAVPLEKSSPLMSLLKEANRVNDILEAQRLKGA